VIDRGEGYISRDERERDVVVAIDVIDAEIANGW